MAQKGNDINNFDHPHIVTLQQEIKRALIVQELNN